MSQDRQDVEVWAREFREGFSRDLDRSIERFRIEVSAAIRERIRARMVLVQAINEQRLSALGDRIARLEIAQGKDTGS